EAVKLMEDAITTLAGALDSWPWRADLRRLKIRVHTRFGAMLRDMGNPAEALKQYRTGLASAQAMVPERQQDLVLQRDLADCYRSLGRYYEKSDCLQARQWYQKDLDIWTAWPRLFPSSSVDQRQREEAARNYARCQER